MSYICAIYSHHVLKGQNYDQDTKIIQINFSYGLNDTEDKRIYYIQDKSQKKYVENFTIYEINMEKCINYWYTKNKKKIEENKEIIMLDLEPEELKLLSEKDRMVEKYMSEIKRVNSNPDFFEYMSAEEDNRKIENSIRKEMTERGLKQGIEQAKLETARNMLKDELDSDTIAKYTGLKKEVIEKIKEEVYRKEK